MSFANRVRFVFLALMAVQAGAQAQDSPFAQLSEIATIEELVMVPMRDGVGLATNVYQPKDAPAGSVPTIFVKTPYNMNKWRDGEQRVRIPLAGQQT